MGYEHAIDMLEDAGEIPKMNKVVVEGIGHAQGKDGIAKIIDRRLRADLSPSDSNSLLPKGFTYAGYRVLSPLEMSQWQIEKNKGSRGGARGRPRGIDVARSTYYMIELNFELPKTPLGETPTRKAVMFVPYIRRGGFMWVRGTEYHTSAVYHTPGLCMMEKGLFANFNFSRRANFKDNVRHSHVYVQGRANAFKIPSTEDFYKGNLNDGGRKLKPTPLPLWLFARYGFTEAIRRYTGVNVAVLTEDVARTLDTDHYVIIRSANEKVNKHIAYVLAVPKKDLPSTKTGFVWTREETNLLTLCVSFFDAANFFAANRTSEVGYLLKSDTINPEDDIRELDDPDVWKIILGKCVLGINGDPAEILKRIRHHLNESLRYICPRFRGELQGNDPDIEDDFDIFDFLYYTTTKLNERRNRRASDIASLYGKRLTVVDYLLLGKDGFTSAVSHLRWKLEGLVKDTTPEELAQTDLTGKITNFINTYMSVGLLQGLESTHGEVSTYSCATESLVLGVSTHAIDQTETSKRSARASVNLDDRKNHIHVSFMEAASIMYLPKSGPFGPSILSPYVKLSPKYIIMEKPHLKPILEPAAADLAKIGGE